MLVSEKTKMIKAISRTIIIIIILAAFWDRLWLFNPYGIEHGLTVEYDNGRLCRIDGREYVQLSSLRTYSDAVLIGRVGSECFYRIKGLDIKEWVGSKYVGGGTLIMWRNAGSGWMTLKEFEPDYIQLHEVNEKLGKEAVQDYRLFDTLVSLIEEDVRTPLTPYYEINSAMRRYDLYSEKHPGLVYFICEYETKGKGRFLLDFSYNHYQGAYYCVDEVEFPIFDE
ncbi:MAG: hypothetical protein LBS51_01870 [Oscillospiraceae bacterium]|nr:hypothetical protein [Oscillospiraceae bacterium]